MSTRGFLLTRAARTSTERPWRTLVFAALLSIASLAFAATHLGIRTSNLDLISPDLPEVRLFTGFAAEFGTPNTLVVVLESDDQAKLKGSVDVVASRLGAAPGVLSVISRDPAKGGLLSDGDDYLTSDDGGMAFIFVQPDDPHSSATTIEPFVRGVQAVIDGADLQAGGVRAGLTGLPRYALDDRDVIQQDISKLSAISLIAVLGLFAVSFRSFARPLLAMAALLVGVAVTLGIAAIQPGHLTLLSAFFASILFGIGIDFGLHIVDRFEQLSACGLEPRKAVVEAVSSQAPALQTGALTTASVFLAMNLTGFRGFAELGTIAGVGVIVCLASMVTVLPALLVLHRPPLRRAGHAAGGRIGGVLMALSRGRFAALCGAAALAAAAVPAPGFDSDYLNLQAAGSEAVRLEREMVRRSQFSPVFAAFNVDSPEAVRELTQRLRASEGVAAVRSLSDAVAASLAGADPVSPALLSRFKSPAGRYAVYAYPSSDVWEEAAQREFVTRMRALDPTVTGMPFLGLFMSELSKESLRIAALAGSVLLVLFVLLGSRSISATLIVMLPVLMTVFCTRASMTLFGISMNPLNIMAWPVILGIAVDDGVHLVHRFRDVGGDLEATLTSSGRSVVLTSLTTIAAFAALAFTRHRGMASFALTLTIGVAFALVLNVVVLPAVMSACRGKLLPPR